ncbi:EAL domain-containing protein [Enterovibrio baiacu]|uniref:EAL domain-containing protein n=1 Tax=Enterovibrio baiacu TaxID=2491023 RepID=UPI001787D55E|nr:EAL domain-containing protein [Enterovibrio baiacu]
MTHTVNLVSGFKIFSDALREAALALLPFMLLRSVWILFTIINEHYLIIDHDVTVALSQMFGLIFPLLLTISLAYHLALGFSYERIHATILTLLLFLKFSGYIQVSEGGIELSSNFVLPQAIAIPVFVSVFYVVLRRVFKFTIDRKGVLNRSLRHHIDATLPYIVIYIFALLLTPVMHYFSLTPFVDWVAEQSMQWQSVAYNLFIHLFWLIGIHGAAAYYTFFDAQFVTDVYVSNIPFTQFFDLFAVPGGAGGTWSLILALLLFSRNQHGRAIAKISLPFALLNINEILLFGLPVIYNPTLAIPFILVPLINQLLAFVLFTVFPISVVNLDLSWITPVLANVWLATDGNVMAVFVQACLIGIGVMIYRPFIRRFEVDSNEMLGEKLARRLRLNSRVLAHGDMLLNKAQNALGERVATVNDHMKQLLEGDLKVYYQPQYNVKTGELAGLEALLRIEKNGVVSSPTFLKDFISAGLASSIDVWVLEQVSLDMKNWKQRGLLHTKVSMNLTVESLLDPEHIDNIKEMLDGLPVVVEITESGYIQNRVEAQSVIVQLQKRGFGVAIDDFGSGYASLSMLAKLKADFVKLDRQFLENASSPEGKILYLHISSALNEMGYTVIAEGVESEAEMALVQECGIEFVQGYYYQPALDKKGIETVLEGVGKA